MAKMLVINPDKCTGCRRCELACSLVKEGEFNPARSRIQTITFLEEAVYIPSACLQCEDPSCEKVRPSGAICREDATGVIQVAAERCVGCKMCLLACPFGAMAFSGRDGKAVKCDLCGGQPECVDFCEEGALEYKETELAMVSRRISASEKLKEAYRTFGE